MTYEALKKYLLLFLIIYFSTGLLARYFSEGTEDVYPFFSWFLFSKVPSRIQTDFAIRIHQFGGKQFEPPIFLEKAEDIYDTTLYSTAEYHRLIQQLAMSAKQNRSEETEYFRSKLEKTFVAHPVVYEAVEIKYNPIDRWKRGQLIKVKSIAIFNSRDPIDE